MRRATLVTFGSTLLATLIVVACASTEDIAAPPADAGHDSGSSGSSTKIPQDAGSNTDPPPQPAKTCATTCSANSECQSSCPTPSAGSVYCCDPSNKCYLYGKSTCPAPPTDGGDPPPSY